MGTASVPQGSPVGPPAAPSPAERVKLPAIFLIVTAAIGMLWQLVDILFIILPSEEGDLASAVLSHEVGGMVSSDMIKIMSGGIGIASSVIALAVGVVVLLGAVRMMALRSYGLALAGAILAMIPCISPCCVLGLPFGIWALVVLMNTEVKAAFH